MANIIEFDCACGATSTSDAQYYDGALGYEAFVCKRCGRYSDEFGEHESDTWSRAFVGLENKIAATPRHENLETNY
jgi:hypothetical protein